MNKFSERLKELRIENNLTQSKLSKETNISQSAIVRWELNQRAPSVDNIITLAKFFKVTSDYLIGLED